MKCHCVCFINSVRLVCDLFAVSISGGYERHGQSRGAIFLIRQQVKENQGTCQYKKKKKKKRETMKCR